MSQLTIRGFDGGITDFYIGARPNQYEKADNFVIDPYNNLINRAGQELDFTTNAARARVPASLGSRRIGLLMSQKTGATPAFTILKQVIEKLQYDNGSAMAELIGPASASAFDLTTPISSETAFAHAAWNDHTLITHESPFQNVVKVYRDSGGTLRLRTAGLPRAANTYTATGGAGANYLYALVRKYTYTVGDVEYIDRSAPVTKEFTGIGTATPASSPGVTVGSIPVLSNGDGDHHDTSVIKVEVYRTINNGTTLYYVGEVTNGTTSYADTTSDDTLLAAGVTLYTSGGEVANTRPPKCKYVHATSDFAYYANAIEVASDSTDLELLPQRLYQSKRGDPDSVPASFYADVEQAITGIGSVRSIPIVFCERSIYRIDGSFDVFGRGGMIPRKIADGVGCVGHLSIVQTLDGLFFAGTDGFYFTDGYQVVPISEQLVESYAAITQTDLQKKRIYGTYDVDFKRVLWAVAGNSNESSDNSKIFCIDTKSKAITTWSSGYSGDAPAATPTGNISGTTISSMSSTTGIVAGMYVVAEDMSPDTYVVSVDSASQVTISPAGPTATGASLVFLDNVSESQFYRQFEPTALLYDNGSVYRGDRKGFTLRFDTGVASDPKLDGSISGGGAVALDTLSIFYSYKGPALDLGTTEYRKWVNGIVVKARPRFDLTSDVTIQPYGENDDSGTPHALEYIFFQPFYPWGSPLIPYGDPRLYRRRATMVDVKRRFPAGKMRCEYKQVSFESAFVDKYQSQVYAVGTVAGSGQLKTVTISGATFPVGLEDYYIAFNDDSYVMEYRILTRDSATQITILDPLLDLTAGASKSWTIRAYLKTSLIQLIEYTVFFEVIGSSQQPYLGENAVNQ